MIVLKSQSHLTGDMDADRKINILQIDNMERRGEKEE